MPCGRPDFSNQAIIYGIDETNNLRTVLLDSSGRIYSVLYGKDYQTGQMGIVAVDSQGRLSNITYAKNYQTGEIQPIGVDSSGNIISLIRGIDVTGTLRTVRLDEIGRVISLIHGKNYQTNEIIPIGTDANGNLIAIIKGQYGDTLKNVAVDADGRIIVKTEDIFSALEQSQRVSLMSVVDRLEYKATVYPHGKILFYEDFEGKPRVILYQAGTGNAFTITDETSFYGSRSLKIEPYKVGPGPVSIIKKFTGYLEHKFNLEFSFAIVSHNGTIVVDIREYAPNINYLGRIRFDLTTDKIEYYDSSGNYSYLASLPSYTYDADTWHHIFFSVNFQTGKYNKLIYNGHVYDMSNISLYPTGAGVNFFLHFRIEYVHYMNNNYPCFIDNIVFSVGGEV